MVLKIHKIVLSGRRLKLVETDEAMRISKDPSHQIICEILNMGKALRKLLTSEQKLIRLNVSEESQKR